MRSNSNQNKLSPMVGIGVMSGTSLDGVDLATCTFSDRETFEVNTFKAVEYPEKWQNRLREAHLLSAFELQLLENAYSEYLAGIIADCIEETGIRPDFISCHGHTIFHQPDIRLTYQMLNGGLIAARTGIKTVCDFRRGDVAQGGQGAPLVPIGDQFLFGKYAACINLGGFANISYENRGRRIAFDICPANIILNELALREGLKYDTGGNLAKSGKIIPKLFESLNALPFYRRKAPKSLGREWVESKVYPLINEGNTNDLLATSTAHIAQQIGRALEPISQKGEILISGGGAYNTHLIESIRKTTSHIIHIPESDIIEGKEAIIFAYLGWLRIMESANILSSVTGGEKDICGGGVYSSG